MFTGIVRELGTLETIDRTDAGARIRLHAPSTAALASVGDSVAVNGVCLTAALVDAGGLWFDAVKETLSRSTIGRLEPVARVNVEPALRAGEPLGGHFVQGHVDGVGRVRGSEPEGAGRRLVVELPPALLRYCVEKGSIAVDGVSLTVAGIDGETFAVALIPHTLAATTLGALVPGDEVNLEVDVIAKYVERLMPSR